MKNLLKNSLVALVVFLLSSCGLSNEEIGETVRLSVHETLSNNLILQEFALQVDDVQVFHVRDNDYKGIATISSNGESIDVPVEILVDGENIMWEGGPDFMMSILMLGASTN